MTSSTILNAASNLLKNHNGGSTNFLNFSNATNDTPPSPIRRNSFINLNVCYFGLSPPEYDSYLASLNEEEDSSSTTESTTSPASGNHEESFSSFSLADSRDENRKERILSDFNKEGCEFVSTLGNTIEKQSNMIELTPEENSCSVEGNTQIENSIQDLKEKFQCNDDVSSSEDNEELILEKTLIKKETKVLDIHETSFEKKEENEEVNNEDLLDNENKTMEVTELHTLIEEEIINKGEINNETNVCDDKGDRTIFTEKDKTDYAYEITEEDSIEQAEKNVNSIEIHSGNFKNEDLRMEGIVLVEEDCNQEKVSVMELNIGLIDLTFQAEDDTDKVSEIDLDISGLFVSLNNEKTIQNDYTEQVVMAIENFNEELDLDNSELFTSLNNENKESPEKNVEEVESIPLLVEGSTIISQEILEEPTLLTEDSIKDLHLTKETSLEEPTLLSEDNIEDSLLTTEKTQDFTTTETGLADCYQQKSTHVAPSLEISLLQVCHEQTNIDHSSIASGTVKEEIINDISHAGLDTLKDGVITSNNTDTLSVEYENTPPVLIVPHYYTETYCNISSEEQGRVLSSPQTIFKATVENLATRIFPKKQAQERDPHKDRNEKERVLEEDTIIRTDKVQDSTTKQSDAMSINSNDNIKVPDSQRNEEQAEVLERDNDDKKASDLEEYLISKLNEEEGYDDLEKKVFASFEGDFSSYEQSIREEIRLLSESIEKRSKGIQESDQFSTPKQEQLKTVELQLLSPESPSFDEGDDSLPPSLKRISPRRLYSHQKIDTLTIRTAIEDYDNQREVYERQRDFQTLNNFEIKIRKDILAEVVKIEERFDYEYEQRKKNIKELLEDQKREISDLWTKRIFEYDQLSVKVLNDINERHKHELVQQEEKFKVNFGRKKPNFSKNTLAERSLFSFIASSKQYERGVGMEEKITDLERRDIINFYHQQELHVAKKLEFVAGKQLQELSVSQQRIDRGRKEMEMNMEDDIKKVDNRSNILFKDLERKKALVSTQLRTFKEKFKGPSSPIKKQIFLHHSEDYVDPIQESTVNINACLEFFLVIPDKINQFFQSVDKTETEVEKETCNVIRRLVDRIEVSHLSSSNSNTSKSPSVVEKKLNNSISPKTSTPFAVSLFKEAISLSPSTSSDSVTPKKPQMSPLKDSPKKTPTRSLEDVLKNKKKPTPKHNFSSLIQYSGFKVHIK